MPLLDNSVSLRVGATGVTPVAAYANGQLVWPLTSGPTDPTTPITLETTPLGGYNFPITVANDNRTLRDSTGRQFYGVFDTGWNTISRMTRAQFSAYAAQRAAQGYTGILLSVLDFSRTATTVATGNTPFLATGIDAVLSQPRIVAGGDNDHWDHLEWCVDQLRQNGLVAVLVPAWYDAGGYGWRGVVGKSVADAESYGQFLASRVGDRTNVWWLMGGDNAPTNTTTNTQNVPDGLPKNDVTAHTNAMANAIKANSSVPQLMSYHTYRLDEAWNYFSGQSWYDLHAAYSQTQTHLRTIPELNRSTIKPVFLVEAYYDDRATAPGNSPFLTRAELRAQSYWSHLTGGVATANGHEAVWRGNASGTMAGITAASAADMTILSRLLHTFEAETFVSSSQNGQPALITSGGGSGATLAVSAWSDNVALAYVPTSRSVTVNLSLLQGSVDVAWMNPTTGAVVAVATGTQASTLSPSFPAGWTDAVLIVQRTSGTIPTPPDNAVTVGDITASTITITWESPDATVVVGRTGTDSYGGGPWSTESAAHTMTFMHLLANTDYMVYIEDSTGRHERTVRTASASLPSSPTNVVAIAGDAQATVTWLAPGSTGGSAITSYVVTIIPNGGGSSTVTVNAPNTSRVVTGLTNGTSYTFTVVAVTSAGTSPASVASNAVTPTAQTAPSGPLSITNPILLFSDTAPATFTIPGGTGPIAYQVTSSSSGQQVLTGSQQPSGGVLPLSTVLPIGHYTIAMQRAGASLTAMFGVIRDGLAKDDFFSASTHMAHNGSNAAFWRSDRATILPALQRIGIHAIRDELYDRQPNIPSNPMTPGTVAFDQPMIDSITYAGSIGVETLTVAMRNHPEFPQTTTACQSFAIYVDEMLRRNPAIKHVNIWNEPNGHTFNRYSNTVEKYGELAKAVYVRCKPKYPDVKFILGALSSYGPSWYPSLMSSYGQYADGYSWHPYDQATEWVVAPYAAMRNHMQTYYGSPTARELHITEIGWAILPNGATSSGNGAYVWNGLDQAGRLVAFYAAARAHNLRRVTWYSAVNKNDGTVNTVETNFGLIERRNEGHANVDSYQPRQSAVALNVFRVMLDGKIFNNRDSLEQHAWCYAFRDGFGNRTRVVWHDYKNASGSAVINAPFASVNRTYNIPVNASKQIRVYDMLGRQLSSHSGVSSISLQITPRPIYVVES